MRKMHALHKIRTSIEANIPEDFDDSLTNAEARIHNAMHDHVIVPETKWLSFV
jgi:hypothetical protein